MKRNVVQGGRVKSPHLKQLKSRSFDGRMVSDRRSPLPSLQYPPHNCIKVSLSSKLLLFGLECQYHSYCHITRAKKGVTVNPLNETATEDEMSVDVLIEDVSIDGMCGVY